MAFEEEAKKKKGMIHRILTWNGANGDCFLKRMGILASLHVLLSWLLDE